MTINIIAENGNWTIAEATADSGATYYIEVKHYELPSEYGIKNGKISKLYISKGDEPCANYDRGWDIRPRSKDAKAITARIIEIFN